MTTVETHQAHQDYKTTTDPTRAIAVDPYCDGGTSPPQPVSDIVPGATPTGRRGKSMSRRVGQNGNVFVKSNCKLGRCDHQRGLCPKYGRYWQDQPGKHERLRVVVPLGKVTQTVAERILRDHILKAQVDSTETFVGAHIADHRFQGSSAVVARRNACWADS